MQDPPGGRRQPQGYASHPGARQPQDPGNHRNPSRQFAPQTSYGQPSGYYGQRSTQKTGVIIGVVVGAVALLAIAALGVTGFWIPGFFLDHHDDAASKPPARPGPAATPAPAPGAPPGAPNPPASTKPTPCEAGSSELCFPDQVAGLKVFADKVKQSKPPLPWHCTDHDDIAAVKCSAKAHSHGFNMDVELSIEASMDDPNHIDAVESSAVITPPGNKAVKWTDKSARESMTFAGYLLFSVLFGDDKALQKKVGHEVGPANGVCLRHTGKEGSTKKSKNTTSNGYTYSCYPNDGGAPGAEALVSTRLEPTD